VRIRRVVIVSAGVLVLLLAGVLVGGGWVGPWGTELEGIVWVVGVVGLWALGVLVIVAPLVLVVAGPAAVVEWIGRVRKRARARRGLCASCGYDRRGLGADAACPECGARAAG
jgi:hypothetical protein